MEKMTVFMCRVDYKYDLLNGEVYIYPSLEELKEKRKCVDECGIVELELSFVRIVEKGTSIIDSNSGDRSVWEV
jgi:hypothetical protein